MSMVDNVERYITFKRHLGFKFVLHARTLRAFADEAVDCSDGFIRAASVVAWARKTSTAGQARIRLRIVCDLAVWLHAEDPRHEIPPRFALGRVPVRRSSPHLLSAVQVKQIMDAALLLKSTGPLNRYTYHYMIGLLATTGLRLSEALALKLSDVTPDGLVVRQSKLGKSRLVPLHDSTSEALSRYLEIRMRMGGGDEHLFVLSSGKPPHHSTLSKIFLRLARQIGFRGGPGELGTRLHDLRHGFATRSLENAVAVDRDSVSRHVLALSTYLGHVNMASTYWYLEATPVLLREIARAAEHTHLRRTSG